MSDNALEKVLAGLWQEVLDVPFVAPDDNFLDLGGDSIRAVRLLNRLQQRSGQVLYHTLIFRSPTVSMMAEYFRRNYPESIDKLIRNDLPSAERRGPGDIPPAVTAPVLTDEKTREISEAFMKYFSPREDTRETPEKNRPAVFILSPFRSGSTLLRVMLAGNPRLFSPPELNLLCFDTLRDLMSRDSRHRFLSTGIERALMEIFDVEMKMARDMLEEFSERNFSVGECYALLQGSLGSRTLVDKSPLYSCSLQALRRAEILFDRPHYIHLMRHPYAMVSSFVEVKMDLLLDLPFSRRELAEFTWLTCHRNILELLGEVPSNRQFHLKFEDLVNSPASLMGDLCRFLSIDFDEDMLKPYEGKKMTDGIYKEGLMMGDPKFFSHQSIDPAVAQRPKEGLREPLCEATIKLAASLGYAGL